MVHPGSLHGFSGSDSAYRFHKSAFEDLSGCFPLSKGVVVETLCELLKKYPLEGLPHHLVVWIILNQLMWFLELLLQIKSQILPHLSLLNSPCFDFIRFQR